MPICKKHPITQDDVSAIIDPLEERIETLRRDETADIAELGAWFELLSRIATLKEDDAKPARKRKAKKQTTEPVQQGEAF